MGTDVQNSLRKAFIDTHNYLLQHCDDTGEFDCALSGTTATVCVFDTQTSKLYTAYVGDSRAILGKISKKSKKIRVTDLSIDHKTNLPNEKKRIYASGGEVRKLEGDVPHRVFVKGRAFPGLAMSRALGDSIAQCVGVSCEPDVSCHKLDLNDEFICVCSDGVWEFLKSKTVGDTI